MTKLFMAVPRFISVFNFSGITAIVFHYSVPCACCFCILMYAVQHIEILKHNLTLRPPEIPPVHLSALQGWTPNPNSFHYEKAGGRSHRAKKTET